MTDRTFDTHGLDDPAFRVFLETGRLPAPSAGPHASLLERYRLLRARVNRAGELREQLLLRLERRREARLTQKRLNPLRHDTSDVRLRRAIEEQRAFLASGQVSPSVPPIPDDVLNDPLFDAVLEPEWIAPVADCLYTNSAPTFTKCAR